MNAQVVLEKIGVKFPARTLFEEVNWTIYEGMRVALAGRNGSGKSTLMQIIAGYSEATEGKRSLVGSRNLRIGYLNQSVLDSAVLAHSNNEDTGTAVKYLCHQLMKEHPEIYEEEALWETGKILSGLGFTKDLMAKPMGALSGGWLLRVFIGAALLVKPQLLLLDEPTNHLDISSIQWLEEFLAEEYEGSLILITHDVALQKKTTNSLAILHGSRFYYRTHQSDYLTFRESLGEEKRLLEKNIESIQKKIDENMEFVYKFRAKAQTAARAQSKLKAAEEMQAEQREMKRRLEDVEGHAYKLHFRFRMMGNGPKFPVSMKDVSFKYAPEAPYILKNVSLDVKRGQKVAIIGENGAGKTTLLNVIAERLKATEGYLVKGEGINEGYFGQHQLDELALDESLLENLRVRAKGDSIEQLRGWLGAFGFPGDEATNKKAKVLSGGEKARLALLRILVAPANILLLDEPTNHLDVETKQILSRAIKDYEGTVVMVSHDRDFLSTIAERIIHLSVDHKMTDHLGDLDSFFAKYPQWVRHIEGHKEPVAKKAEPKPTDSPKLDYEERKKIKNTIRSLEKKIQAAEAEMASGEEHAKMGDWEKWSAELESLKTKYPDIK